MEDAWQSQDIAPTSSGGGIGIPTHDGSMSNGGGHDDAGWNGAGGPDSRDREGRGPGGDRDRDRDRDGPRRSSRSRSPVRNDRGRGEGGGTNPGNNLHVSGLATRVDTRDLEAAFGKIGRVQKASVMLDPHTRESRGFGFVTMETAEEADAAITALNAVEFMGKVMNVEKARRGRARTPTPGRYYGPPKRHERERFYDPRPYDSRYARDDDHRRGGGRYDDPPPRRGDYDRHGGGHRGGYEDRERGERGYDRGGRGDYEKRDYDRRY